MPLRPGVSPPRVSPPGVSPPRVSPWAMVHRAYSPAGYVHSGPFGYPAKFAGVRRRPPLPWYVHSGPFGYPASFPASAEVVRDGPCRSWGRAFLRSDRNKCTSSSCFCLRILVRLRGQRSIRKTCVSIRNITYFISPVHMAGMFILQASYLLPISAVCFPRCSRNPRAVNNPSRRN